MTQPGEIGGRSYRYLPASEGTARRAYRGVWGAVLLVFLATLARLRIRGARLSAVEVGLVFLTGLLLSPITFTHHLVSLLFVFSAFLAIRPARPSSAGTAVVAVLGVAIAVTGLGGRDLVGKTASLSVWGYSIPAWTMLLLFVTAAVLAGREPSPYPGPRPG